MWIEVFRVYGTNLYTGVICQRFVVAGDMKGDIDVVVDEYGDGDGGDSFPGDWVVAAGWAKCSQTFCAYLPEGQG